MGVTLLEPAAGVRPQPERASPRTVCHLIASNFFGGPEKQILEHCRRIDPARWQPVVGSFREGRDRVPIQDAAEERGIPAFVIDTRIPWSPDAARQLHRFLRRHKVDLVVTHGYKPNALGFLLRRWSRIPQIAYVRGYTAETWRVRRYEQLDRWLLKRAFTRVLCVSEMTRLKLVAYGVAPEQVLAIHNAVETPKGVKAAPLRHELGIPDHAPLLLAAGRLSAEKGHRFLIDALKHVPEAHAVILGEGRERETLNTLARVLEVDDRVHLVGFRRDVLACLRAADVVVNPSLSEGLPNVVLEAQSLEVPVVATDVGGVAEILDGGKTGWLVSPGNPQALAGAIKEAIADRAKAADLALAGRRRIEEKFTFALQTERLMAVYDDAVGH